MLSQTVAPPADSTGIATVVEPAEGDTGPSGSHPPSPSSLSSSQHHQHHASSVTSYVQDHQIHVLLDRMVKELLTERPVDSDSWMLRWLLEQHRQQCAKKHLQQSQGNGDDGEGNRAHERLPSAALWDAASKDDLPECDA